MKLRSGLSSKQAPPALCNMKRITAELLFCQLEPEALHHHFWKHVDKTPTCWIWTRRVDARGYGLIHFWTCLRAHRISWRLHHGAIPEELCVLHNCPGADNPSCVNPEHLWLGTRGDNVRDASRKGRLARCGLDSASVLQLRSLYASGAIGHVRIARLFGIHPRTAWDMIARNTWKWLD